jgi:O-antigen/teichoic acid export membrane protein
MIKHILSTFFTRFFVAASNLAIAILLSNYLGASGRGEQSLVITLISFIIIITGIIGTASISYLIPRYSFSVLIIPSYLWVFIVFTIGYVALPYLNLVPAGYNLDVCILSLLLSLVSINMAVLISHQRISAANFLNFLQALVIVVALIISFVLLKHKSIESYLLALYAGYGITLVVSFALIGPYFRGFHIDLGQLWGEAFKRLAVLGFYNQIAVFTQLLSFRLSYYILDSYFGRESVGVYANAVSIAESIWLIGRSIATVQHSRIVNSNDASASLKLTAKLNAINTAISVILILILACIPGSWYVFIFGHDFTNINRIIWSLGPGIVFFGIALILGYYFSSTGRHYVNAIASATGLIVTLVLGYAVIPVYKTYGAGFTASISYGVTALVVVAYYFREKKRVIKKTGV